MTEQIKAHPRVPSASFSYAGTGRAKTSNELGMRVMQERAYERRGEQYLLIKAPPASGKSRALMFIALDKLNNQGIRKAIIVVPEKSIGANFSDVPLAAAGFHWDWEVTPKWNLCHAPGNDAGGKVSSVSAFLDSPGRVLVCTHATFRFAVDRCGIEAFDNCLLAVDEFHHVSANPDNMLGNQLTAFIARDKVHIVAMTGSYFRGDTEAVLSPEDEARFETVTYTWYEQLNGYDYLKTLDIAYHFYSSGDYTKEIGAVLDPDEKTIVHIPRPASRESQQDKYRESDSILSDLGTWDGTDGETGFQLIRTRTGRLIRVADLVDDDPAKRDKVSAALRRPEARDDRDFVDVIIALGMAKEGFDWVWCEHALTVGHRSSLTEIVQIIGRTTRDAEGKTRARFTNLVAEPDASGEAVTDAVNDTLKAIAASLLMEQVFAPKFDFTPKTPASGPKEGFDYGEEGYKPDANNVGYNEETGQVQIEINGLAEPASDTARRICREDTNELVAAFVQDKPTRERGMFDEEMPPQELNKVRMGSIVRSKYPDLSEEDHEAVRQHAIAAMNMIQQVKAIPGADATGNAAGTDPDTAMNTAFVDGVRKYVTDVRDLDIDLIDSINPFSQAYAILAKSMNENSLQQVQAAINARRTALNEEEARELALRAVAFRNERGRLPDINAADPWERRMAEGIDFIKRLEREKGND